MAASTISRITWTDDSGLGTDGSIINNSFLSTLQNNIDAMFAGSGSYTTLTLGGKLALSSATSQIDVTWTGTSATLTLQPSTVGMTSNHALALITNNATRMTVSAGGIVMIAHTTTTTAAAGDLCLKNTASFRILNTAGTSNISVVTFDASDRLTLGCNNSALSFNLISTAAAATAGTNGATPAQVAGYLIVIVNGVTNKIPYYNN